MSILSQALIEKTAHHKQRSHRIEGLSDAVFAIAMTLLVLDIRIPLKEIDTETGVWDLLIELSPKLLTYILSFSVAGQFWSIFTNHFNYLHTSDRNEFLIGLLFLMFVSLLPFSTAFLSEHLGSRVAMGFYIFNLVLILSFNTLHWYYSYHFGLVKVEENQTGVVNKAILNRARIAFGAYAILIFCCLFSSYVALFGFIFVHIILTFSGFIQRLNLNQPRRIRTTAPELAEGTSLEFGEPASIDNEQSKEQLPNTKQNI